MQRQSGMSVADKTTLQDSSDIQAGPESPHGWSWILKVWPLLRINILSDISIRSYDDKVLMRYAGLCVCGQQMALSSRQRMMKIWKRQWKSS